VRAHADEVVTLDGLRNLQALVNELDDYGVPLGPSLVPLAVEPDSEHELAARAFQNPQNVTFRELFGLGSAGSESARGYYDANVAAALQHAAAGSRLNLGGDGCSRCQNPRVRTRFGGRCTQTYFQGHLLNNGACNECQLNGNHAGCSFFSKSSLPLVFWSFD
jgi:hypothetical protein